MFTKRRIFLDDRASPAREYPGTRSTDRGKLRAEKVEKESGSCTNTMITSTANAMHQNSATKSLCLFPSGNLLFSFL